MKFAWEWWNLYSPFRGKTQAMTKTVKWYNKKCNNCFFFFAAGTGTGMSHRVVVRCAWFCTISRLLRLKETVVSCSSGVTSTASPRTALSANTQKVSEQMTDTGLLYYWELFNTDFNLILKSVSDHKWNTVLICCFVELIFTSNVQFGADTNKNADQVNFKVS